MQPGVSACEKEQPNVSFGEGARIDSQASETHVDVGGESFRPGESTDEAVEAFLGLRVLRVELGDGALDEELREDGRRC